LIYNLFTIWYELRRITSERQLSEVAIVVETKETNNERRWKKRLNWKLHKIDRHRLSTIHTSQTVSVLQTVLVLNSFR